MNMNINIKTSDINKIRDIANILAKSEYPVEIVKDRYIVNGKSLLGILSLDWSTGATIVLNECDAAIADQLKSA